MVRSSLTPLAKRPEGRLFAQLLEQVATVDCSFSLKHKLVYTYLVVRSSLAKRPQGRLFAQLLEQVATVD